MMRVPSVLDLKSLNVKLARMAFITMVKRLVLSVTRLVLLVQIPTTQNV